jgi:hypothetical protein
MPALEDPRREQFAQLVASGKEFKESYISAGYKGKGAGQSAARLNRDEKVAARIAELRTLAQQIPLASSWLNENFVLQGLKTTFERALADSKYSDAIAALNLMGKKLGLWIEKVDHNVHWDGDPSTLNDRQLGILREQLERIAYGDDAERIRSERERALKDAGLLIEGSVEPETSAHDEVIESTLVERETPLETPISGARSWSSITDPEERKRLAAEWQARGPALPEGLNKEERIAWLNENWPLSPENSGW